METFPWVYIRLGLFFFFLGLWCNRWRHWVLVSAVPFLPVRRKTMELLSNVDPLFTNVSSTDPHSVEVCKENNNAALIPPQSLCKMKFSTQLWMPMNLKCTFCHAHESSLWIKCATTSLGDDGDDHGDGNGHKDAVNSYHPELRWGLVLLFQSHWGFQRHKQNLYGHGNRIGNGYWRTPNI